MPPNVSFFLLIVVQYFSQELSLRTENHTYKSWSPPSWSIIMRELVPLPRAVCVTSSSTPLCPKTYTYILSETLASLSTHPAYFFRRHECMVQLRIIYFFDSVTIRIRTINHIDIIGIYLKWLLLSFLPQLNMCLCLCLFIYVLIFHILPFTTPIVTLGKYVMCWQHIMVIIIE